MNIRRVFKNIVETLSYDTLSHDLLIMQNYVNL